MKKFICGVLTGTMLMTTVPALAESTQSINAIFGRVKVVVNDKPVEQETLLYNGTTYVPLRAISEILAKDVNYDNITRTAYIDEAGSNRSDLIEDAHLDLQIQYVDSLKLQGNLLQMCSDGLGDTGRENYSQARTNFNNAIKGSNELINNFSSSSPELTNDTKKFATELKKSAEAGLLLVDSAQASNINGMDTHYATFEKYIDQAMATWKQTTNEAVTLFK